MFVIDATGGRQSSLVDAVALPDQRVVNVVDLVANHRSHVARKRRLATGKQRRQSQLGDVPRHASVISATVALYSLKTA